MLSPVVGRVLTRRTLEADQDPPYFASPLYPRTTGLPMIVWVSPRGNARHDVRIKLNATHGNQMNIDNTATVAVRPSPHVVAGRLSTDDERVVTNWITLNAEAILAYWNGNIDTMELVQTLKPLSSC